MRHCPAQCNERGLSPSFLYIPTLIKYKAEENPVFGSSRWGRCCGLHNSDVFEGGGGAGLKPGQNLGTEAKHF